LRTWGLTNRLKNDLRLFFYEYDETPEYDVLEDANFLSQAFGIDVYVLCSSKGNYHVVSFDVLSFETVNSIQNWTAIRGDYINGKDRTLDGGLPHNTLRLGTKGTKTPPTFVKVFYSREKPKLKSLGHFNAWKALCKLPEPPEHIKEAFVNMGYCMLSVYKTGIGAKPKEKPDTYRIR
jgi:hypothetical protein